MSQKVPECPVVQNSLNENRSADTENGSSLNEQQQCALELLLQGKRPCEIVRQLGIDRRTLYRWRKDEEFGSELHRRREEIWSSAADRLRSLFEPALRVLAEQLTAPYDRARFRAAATVLRIGNLRKGAPVEAEEVS